MKTGIKALSRMKASSIGAFFLVFLTFPAVAFAPANSPLPATIEAMVDKVVGWILAVGWGVLAVYAVFTGVQWAMGDGKAIQYWKHAVFAAIVFLSADWLVEQLKSVR